MEDENIKSYFLFQKIFEKYNSDELEYLKFLLSGSSKKKTSSQNNEIERFLKLLNIINEKKIDDISIKANKLINIVTNLEKNNFSLKFIEDLLFKELMDLFPTLIISIKYQ